MLKTPFHDWHVSHGATMTAFNGWDMPLYYKGITEEHLQTRKAAGLFDLCHMGRVIIRGHNALEFTDSLTPARMRQGKPGDVLYSFLLNEEGRTLDDITIYLASDHAFLVINAGNRERDVEWIRKQAESWEDVRIDDISMGWAMIAIQGPASEAIYAEIFGAESAPKEYYKYFVIADPKSEENRMIVSTTGYTGEKGYELYMPRDMALGIWDKLMTVGQPHGLVPVGLGARDSLRLEAAMPLYGHELTEETTPFAAGLGKFVDLEKTAFIGREALLAEKEKGGPTKRLLAFEMEKRGPVARQGHEVYSTEEKLIGTVASGIFSPTLQKNIGTCFVESGAASVGSQILLDIRGRKHPAVVVKKPFYKRSY